MGWSVCILPGPGAECSLGLTSLTVRLEFCEAGRQKSTKDRLLHCSKTSSHLQNPVQQIPTLPCTHMLGIFGQSMETFLIVTAGGCGWSKALEHSTPHRTSPRTKTEPVPNAHNARLRNLGL